MISIIVATSNNGIIAVNGKIPWKCPADMQHFKETTTGNVVVMGRKTWDSIGNKLLPNRTNVVISKSISNINFDPRCKEYLDKDIIPSHKLPFIATSIDGGIEVAHAASIFNENMETFIIGGADIYRQCLQKNIVDKIYLSSINDDLIEPYGDDSEVKTFHFDESQWNQIQSEDREGFKLLVFEKVKNA